MPFVREDKKRVYYKCIVCGKPFSYKKGTRNPYIRSQDYCISCLRNKTPQG